MMADEDQTTAQPDVQSQDGTGTTAEKRRPLSLLAREAFGNEFHGEVTEEDPPKPKPDDQDETDDGGDPTEGGDDDDEVGKQSQQADAKDDDAAPIESVQELLEHLEADPAWFDGLKVNVKVNDKTSQVPLRDLVHQYQTSQAADERLAQVKQKSDAVQQELQQRTAAVEQHFAVAAKLAQDLEQQFLSDYAAVDWNKLQAEDPAMWAAQRQAFGERNGRIQQAKNEIATGYRQRQQEIAQANEQQLGTTLQEQSQLLEAAMPRIDKDWADPQKLPTKKAELASYLLTQGFTPQEITATADHRSFLVAQKAMLWDKSQGKVELSKKRIRTVPKVISPGAKREPSAINLDKVRAARMTLKKSGRLEDAAAVFRAKRQG